MKNGEQGAELQKLAGATAGCANGCLVFFVGIPLLFLAVLIVLGVIANCSGH